MKNRKKGSGSESDVGPSEQEGRGRQVRDGVRRRGGAVGGAELPMANGDIAKGEFVGQRTAPRANGGADSRKGKGSMRSRGEGVPAGGRKVESVDDLKSTKSRSRQGTVAAAGPTKGEWRGYMFMSLLAVQYGLQPILCKHFTDKRVITTSMVLSCEVVKILCAVAIITFQGKVMELVRLWTLRDSLTCSALPAAIYALQNYLIQTAYQNLDFLSFTMLNQTKLLFTAFFMFILLRHKQSLPQMGALMLMVVAAVMLTVGQATPSAVSLAGFYNLRKGALSVPSFLSKVLLDTKSLYSGVIPVLSASVLSGLASSLCQMAMQNKGRNSYLMTVEMSLAGSLVLLCSMLQSPDGEKIVRQGFFYAWEKTTMIPVVSNAFGGIMVGVVTKHVGGVKKGFAIVSALIVTGIGQVVIDGHLPSPYVWVSLPLVVGSTLIHTRYPYVKQVKTV